MFPLQVTIRDMPNSAAIESLIRKRAEKLLQYYDRIMSCKVVIELPQKHKHQGKLFNVRIDVNVPGKSLVSTRKYSEDINIAIRDSFAALERQLEDHARKRQGHIKTHEETMKGHISRLIPSEGYGFIEGMDGNEYYFSLTNVAYPQFSQLVVGDFVDYIGIVENDGFQAHHVTKNRQETVQS